MSLLSLLPIVGDVLDKIIPDPAAQAEAKCDWFPLWKSWCDFLGFLFGSIWLDWTFTFGAW